MGGKEEVAKKKVPWKRINEEEGKGGEVKRRRVGTGRRTALTPAQWKLVKLVPSRGVAITCGSLDSTDLSCSRWGAPPLGNDLMTGHLAALSTAVNNAMSLHQRATTAPGQRLSLYEKAY